MNIEKRAYDKRLYDINVGPAMRLADTIAMVDGISEAGVRGDLTIDDIEHTGAVISFSVSGGVAGCEYDIVIRWATEGAPMQTLESVVRLVILWE